MVTKGSYIKVVNGELAGQILLVKDITPSGDFLDCINIHGKRLPIQSDYVVIASEDEAKEFNDSGTNGGFM